MVEGSDNLKLKMYDFNTAVQVTPHKYEDQIVGGTGVKKWSAPETRKQLTYSGKCDIWSVGCILFFLITGGEMLDSKLSSAENRARVLELIGEEEEALSDLIKGLMDLSPITRFTAAEALKHVWFADLNEINNQATRESLKDNSESSL